MSLSSLSLHSWAPFRHSLLTFFFFFFFTDCEFWRRPNSREAIFLQTLGRREGDLDLRFLCQGTTSAFVALRRRLEALRVNCQDSNFKPRHRPCCCLLHAWRRRNQHDNTHINNPPAAVMEGSTSSVGGTQAAHQKYWHSSNPRASSKLILWHQILRC
jgi:hypothetical protein